MVGRAFETTMRAFRRSAVLVIGSIVLLVGIALILLPGPAILVIPLGLAILGVEFAWARRWLRRVRERSRAAVDRFTEDSPADSYAARIRQIERDLARDST